jgi:kanamycin kinase
MSEGAGVWLATPDGLAKAYADWHWDLAWQYEGHSLVYRLSRGGAPELFLKLAPVDEYPGLPDEAARMRWAHAYLPVPEVVGLGTEGSTAWLATTRLSGRDGTDADYLQDPEGLARTLAAGLRRFHEAAPVRSCPFDFRLEVALGHVRRRLTAGLIDPERDFHPEFRHFSATESLEFLEVARPGTEDLVVCHGDYCPPNVLIENGRVSGFVDLGELGVADRWSDLAVATWSVTWNLGPGYEELFLSEYGVDPDADRLKYYRLLYDLVC